MSASSADSLPTPPRRGFQAFLVGRPVTVLMLFLTLLGTGAMAYLRIPLTLLPEGLSSDSLTVVLPYPGAGPMEVGDQLTRPVEEALRTIPGIHELFSVSSENRSRITVTFSSFTDMDVAYGEVRDRIERIRGSLPPEMDRYYIRRWNLSTDVPIMWIGIQYDAEADDPFGPIERIAIPRIEGTEGVAQARLRGVVDEVVRIFVDVEKVRGYGVDLGAVIRRMQADNFTLPAGFVDDGGRTFALRIDARFHDLEDVRSYPIGGGRVMADIAKVVQGRAWRDDVSRLNGRSSLGLAVSRESDRNTIDVCTRVREVIEALERDPRLADVTFNIFFDQKETILQAIGGLQASAGWGGLFAVLVLFFFLRDLRMTLIAALAIPASLLAALTAVYFGGQTLNLVSLSGFTLAIGMLVDNAVVVIENIARRRAERLGRAEAAVRGAGEVGLAVLAATLTSIAVFLPLVFMGSNRQARVLMKEVGLPISWCLLASLLVAMVFIPAFTARLMRRRPRHDVTELSPRLVATYSRALDWGLRHRFGTFVILMVVMFISYLAGSNLPSSNTGDGGSESVRLDVEVPSSYRLEEADRVFERLEIWAEEHMADIGFEWYSANFDRRGGSLRFWPEEDLARERAEVMDEKIREALPRFPGVKLTVDWEGGSNTGEVRLDIHGPDFGELARISAELKPRLAALRAPGGEGALLENLRTDVDRGLDEVHVRIDRERAALLGIPPEMVRGMVAWGLGGQRLPALQSGEAEIPMVIEYDQDETESLDFLRNLGVTSLLTGASVPLATIAHIRPAKALGALVRRNGRSTMGLTARPTVENVYLVSRRVREVLDAYPLPEGYTWSEEGGQETFEQDMGELQRTFGLSVVLVYLLMAILLESAVLPLSILISIPLALMGVNLTLWVAGYPLEPMVAIGMILLAGIVVNNAIVLLDRVQRLRAAGLNRDEALRRGGAERLRPIVMTALTTIFGLLPMAVPHWFPGNEEKSGYETLAATVAGGLAFSTFFTLLAVPWAYSLFDDLGRILGGLLPWRSGPQSDSETTIS